MTVGNGTVNAQMVEAVGKKLRRFVEDPLIGVMKDARHIMHHL